MNTIEKKKNWMMLLAVLLIILYLLATSHVYAAETLSITNVGSRPFKSLLSYTAENTDSVSYGSVEVNTSTGVITLTAKGYRSTGSDFTSSTTVTITAIADLESVKFTFNQTGSGGSVSTSKNSGVSLDQGESITFSLTSPKGSGKSTTATLTISSATLKPKQITTTFKAPVGGSYTVDGSDITATTTNTQSSTMPYTLSATASSGYTFTGWCDEEGRCYSTSASYSYDGVEDHTIWPLFQKSGVAMYYVNGSTDVYYEYLDSAIAAAGSSKTVVVYRTGEVKGTNNLTSFTIPSGVTLLVPFDDNATVYTTEPEVVYGAHVTPSAFRTLTMNGVSFTVANGGKISVASNLCATGTGSGSWNGTPSGPGGRVVMSNNASITLQSGAGMYVYGYVSGRGTVTAESGSTVYEAMQFRCWRGGTATSGMTSGVFPMNQYYIQNIEVPLKIYSGANEYIYTAANMSSTAYPASTQIIGKTAGMFRITDGYIIKSFDGTKDRLNIDIYGSMSINSLSVKMAGQTISSSAYNDLPITNNMSIHVHSGTVSSAQKLAFLAGTELIVDSGANVEFSSNIYIYDQDEWGSGYFAAPSCYVVPVGYSVANGTNTKRATTTKPVDAMFDINGTLTVSGKLYTTTGGANITSSNKTGRIVLSSAPTATTTTQQATQSNTDITLVTINCTAAQLKNGDSSYTATAGASAGDVFTYCSEHNKWEKNRQSYTITFNANGGTGTMPDQSICAATSGGTLNTHTFEPEYSCYTFAGWNTSADGTGDDYAENAPVYSDLDLYAKWNANHTYGAPTAWSWDGYSSATATFACSACGHETTVTATGEAITSAVTTQPGCETEGVRTYTATVTVNGTSYTGTKTEAIAATGHDYDYTNAAISWANDYSTATRTAVCANDELHTVIQTVNTTSQTIKAAACSEGGTIRYTAEFSDPYLNETKDVSTEALGHDYVPGAYTWTWDAEKDTYIVTCTAVCSRCDAFVNASSDAVRVISEEQFVYTAEFEAPFATQTRTDTYGVTYEWEEGHICSAYGTDEQEHRVLIESVEATDAVTTEPGCVNAGVRTWTAVFQSSQLAAQTTTEPIDPIGHDFGSYAYTWSYDDVNDVYRVTGTRVCSHDDTHTESIQSVSVTLAEGNTQYNAAFENGNSDSKNAVAVSYLPGFDGGQSYTQYMAEGVSTKLAVSGNTLNAPDNYTFTGWSGSDGVTYSDGTYITVAAPLTLTAQWDIAHTYTVSWINSMTNEQICEPVEITSIDDIKQPVVPSYLGNDFTAWDVSISYQQAATISVQKTTAEVGANKYLTDAGLANILKALLAEYSVETDEVTNIDLTTVYTASDTVFTVSASYMLDGVDTGLGISAPATVQQGKSARLTVNDTYTDDSGKEYTFVYWDYNGQHIQSTQIIVRATSEDIVLKACYESNAAGVQAPSFYLTDAYAETINGVNKIAVVQTYDVPDGYTITGIGFYYATSAAKVTGDSPTGSVSKKVPNERNGTYTLHISVKTNVTRDIYVRGYATYTDSDGTAHTWMADDYSVYTWQSLYDAGRYVQ